MKKEKRTIYIDGLKIGFNGGATLLTLVNKEINNLKNSNSSDRTKTSLLHLANSIQKYLAQWENIQLGDKVEYYPNIITMKNLFETRPEPKQMEFDFSEPKKTFKQMEQDQKDVLRNLGYIKSL